VVLKATILPMGKIAVFNAVLPDVASALKVSGQGDGRVQFDVPESDLPEILKLIAFGREKLLKVTVDAE
jgi:hypothetical protein